MLIQPDGKILVAGASFVARLESTGALDAAFGDAGIALPPPGTFYDVALQADGKIVVAGSRPGGFGLVGVVGRLLADGSVDMAFGTAGEVTLALGSMTTPMTRFYAVAVWQDGIVAGGHDYRPDALFFTLTDDGMPDTTQTLALGRSQSHVSELELDAGANDLAYVGFYRDYIQTGGDTGTTLGSLASPDAAKLSAPSQQEGTRWDSASWATAAACSQRRTPTATRVRTSLSFAPTGWLCSLPHSGRMARPR
jgi:uncharacterized delta-60 repeat protein